MADVQQSEPPLRQIADGEGAGGCGRAAVLHCKACVCLPELQEWQESPVLLPELHSKVGFARAPTDAKLVNNWAASAGTSPRPPREAQTPNLFLPLWSLHIFTALGGERISPQGWDPSRTRSCRGCAARRCRGAGLWAVTARADPQPGCEWETSRERAGSGGLCTRTHPHPATEPLTSRCLQCWFLTACMELSQEARDGLLATAALCSLGYGGTARARP